MYETFYGLKEKPFNLNPDPDFLYMSRVHEMACIHLEYAIMENKGFVIITGEIGSGKTTLINYLLRKIPEDIEIGIINNTLVKPSEFLRMICKEYELPVESADKTTLLTHLHTFLLEQFSRGRRVILIVDEAQNLPDVTIEEIRLLSNLESEKHHLIQIILVGQPQLKEKLQQKSLEQFVQRVTVHCHLDALDKAEVADYVRHRLQVAGAAEQNLFTDDALRAVYKYSLGIPRLINILCDTALVYGYADEKRVIEREIVESVAEARQIGRLSRPAEPAAAPEESAGTGSPFVLDGAPGLEGRVRDLELTVAALQADIRHLAEDLAAVTDGRDKRDKIILTLFRMLRKNLRERARLTVEMIEVKKKLLPPQLADGPKPNARTKPPR